MASFFPYASLVPSGADVFSFLVTVNVHGHAVLYRLNADGRTCSMAAGSLVEMLTSVLASKFPDVQVRFTHGFTPGYFGLSRWRDVVAVLNGKPNAARRIVLDRINAAPEASTLRLRGVDRRGHARLTDQAKAEDAKWDKWDADEAAEKEQRRADQSNSPSQ